MTVLELHIPGRPLSANDRLHWRAKAREVARIRMAARMFARHQWGPLPWPELVWPVAVTVRDECRTANLRDSGNAAPAVKAIIDGLTDAGLWPDDGPDYVASIRYLPATKTGADGLVLTITDEAQR